ncbi:MAG: asparagine synthase (glutamine-hydrolyzing) [Myxococcota bacterium]|nr:asparagine synthase (glutamine-hydrolyzing) [Myxococcota bacterium]
MCGIAGLVLPGGVLQDPGAIDAMLTSLAHRGPDERGERRGESVVLGATRLAIVDPTSGQQPFSVGPVWGVMNGEVYNHGPLRKELVALGIPQETLCDGEVMVGLAAHSTPRRALDRLDGMFALALWDERDQSLTLARDRVGQKPLYWTRLPDGTLAFASELKGLLVLPQVRRALDPVALQQLLLFEFIPAPRTIYQGIHKLEAGTLLRLDRDGLRIERWWEPPLPGARTSRFDPGRERHLGALRTAVRQAVGRRLPEGPVALLTSGGIDSSVVAACAMERRGEAHAFSMGFSEASFDESGPAAELARHLGLQAHPLHFGPTQLEQTLETLSVGLCEPLTDGSLPSTLRLCQAVHQAGFKVALGGDGADEHLGGYPTYLAHRALPAAPARGSGLLRRIGARVLPEDNRRNLSAGVKLRRFAEGAGMPWQRRNQVWLGAFTPQEIPALLGVPLDPAVWEPVDRWAARVQETSPALRAMYLDQRLYLAEGVLQKVDRASMLTSLEVRAPFVDHHLVALAASLPEHLKVGPVRTKAGLRDAFADALPASLLRRPKKGFGTPLGPWLRGPQSALLQDLERQLAGWIDPEPVAALRREHRSGQRDHRRRLWTLLLLARWRKGPWG